MVEKHVATRLVLQKRKVRDVSDNDDSKSLHVALQRQNNSVHGEVDAEIIVRYELYNLSTRHPGMQTSNGEPYALALNFPLHVFLILFLFVQLVSHTTDDMIFQW